MRGKCGPSQLSVPVDRYQLDVLLKPGVDPRTGKVKSGFETVADCVAEDEARVQLLRETAARIRANSSGIPPLSPDGIALKRLNIDLEAALHLADRLEAATETLIAAPTLASALDMRDRRLQLAARLLELIENQPELQPQMTFTAIHSTWGFSASGLMAVNAGQINNQFRTHLNRAKVTKASGYLFAYLHGEFEPSSRQFQLHFHGLCAGEKAQALHQLRNRQGFVRTDTIYRPIVIKPLEDYPEQFLT